MCRWMPTAVGLNVQNVQNRREVVEVESGVGWGGCQKRQLGCQFEGLKPRFSLECNIAKL